MPAGLLGIEELDRAEIEAILARAKDFQPMQSQSLKKLDALRGKMIVNLFFEASPSILYAASSLKIPILLTLHNYRLICANALLLRNGKPCELCVKKTFPLSGIRYRCYRNSSCVGESILYSRKRKARAGVN